jgi:type I restriction enzyme, S subunit
MSFEWLQTTWGEVATLDYGKAIRDYQNASGEYPVYGPNGPIGWHHTALCRTPGVIVGRKGAYRGIHYSDRPFFVIDTAFFVNPKVDMDLRWAYYCLLTYDINGMDSGSAIPSTSRDEFYRLPVVLPSKVEQVEIAKTLALFDDRISLLRETNTTLESIAQALFKSWFVDFDPVRAKQQGTDPQGMDAATAALFPDSFEASELGEVPKGWRVKSLDAIAEYLNGLALQKFPPEENNWLPVIKISQLRKGDTTGADRANRNLKPENIIQNGDVLFSWSGSLEVIIWCGGEGALNQHLFKVTSVDYPKWFYYLWTKHHLANFQQIAESKATTMGHIQRKHLTEAKVVVPPADFVAAANPYFEPLIERWIATSIQAQTLATLRDTLLPRLISGQLRLPEAQSLSEEMSHV